METIVIWNTGSGSAVAAAAAEEALRRRAATHVREVRSREEAAEAAREAARAGAELVVAAGGDGTINAVVNGLLTGPGQLPVSRPDSRSVPVLGVLPIGTANDFARTIAMPLDPFDAIRSFDAPDIQTLDVVRTTSEGQTHYFINMATAGNSERIIENLTPQQKEWWGPLCYIRGAIDVALDLLSYEVTLRLDEEPPQSHTVWNLILANGRTSAAGLHVAPRADPADGLIDVIVVTDGTLPDLVQIGARLWLDKFMGSDLVHLRRARIIEVASTPPLRFTADGDVIEWVPARFDIQPAALRVLVGPGFRATAGQ
jgi:diacylglycerol kinase (ATP)